MAAYTVFATQLFLSLLLLCQLLLLLLLLSLLPPDRIVETISDFATALGNAAKCDPWAVEIFAEEVVRGGPAFAISLVLSAIEPTLRQLAELGAWQVRGFAVEGLPGDITHVR